MFKKAKIVSGTFVVFVKDLVLMSFTDKAASAALARSTLARETSALVRVRFAECSQLYSGSKQLTMVLCKYTVCGTDYNIW